MPPRVMLMAAVLVLTTACARPGPTTSPLPATLEPSITPRPTRWIAPTPTPPPPLPTPPPEFDPADIVWAGHIDYGQAFGTRFTGTWIGTADGSGERVSDTPGALFRVVGREVYFLDEDGLTSIYTSGVWAVTVGSTPRMIGTASSGLTIAEDAGVAFVARADGDGDLGVWQLPLAGGDATQVIRPGSQYHDGLATSPDGRRLAAGRCGFQGENAEPMELVVDGHLEVLDFPAHPLGFDERGRLVFRPCFGGTVSRMGERGEIQVLVEDEFVEVRVTRDGRFLVVLVRKPATESRPELPIDLRVTKLDSGITWLTTIPGDWALTTLGDNDYAVLQGRPPGGGSTTQGLVVSLEGHWWGVLDPIPAWWSF